MTIQGLDWQTIQFSFTSGLDTKAHGYALDPPGLSSCKNIEFDEAGALRLRKPYASIGVNIYGGGTLSNVRKLAVVGDELLCFTSTTLYSWSETLTAWVSRGEHLAVAVAESTRFGNTSDQVFADRAQLGGVVVMAWTEVLGAAVTEYVAGYDATTGATTIAPTSIGSGSRVRVVALSTKILVTWLDVATGLYAKVIDPAAPSFTSAGATLLSFVVPTKYDIEKDPSADRAVWVAVNAGGADYEIGTVTSALAVARSTKVQTSDGVIAVSCAPAAANFVRVIRATAAFDVKSDLITLSTLVDATMNTMIGTAASAILQLTGAHRSVTNGGQYRCYAFWSSRFSATAVTVETNWVDTSGAIGTENSAFIGMSAVASRAFDYGGSVYLWSVFSEPTAATIGGSSVGTSLGIRGQFQNTYFLIRDDAYLVSQATKSRAGGSHYYDGHLPGVALVSGSTGYAWAGTERQIVVLGGTDTMGYSARAPRDITFAFDSDDARRVVQIGRTAYVSGGMLVQYDGEGLTEVGFMQYPWRLQLVLNVGGALDVGVYSYKSTLRWDNARGETERSTTAVGVQVTIAAGDKPQITVYSDFATRKLAHPPSVEVWRQKVNSNTGAPFYLTTSRDPATTGTDNCYLSLPALPTLTTAGSDNFTDATLETKEQSPENGDVLPRLAPPGASIMAASDVRMFLAGIPGDPYTVAYSLLRNEGEIVGFFDDLRFTIPSTTGPITALALQAETLVVFTASAVYVVPGDGFDNTGGGSNYGPPRMISTDVGALSHDTLALTPAGLVFFSRKGWYRLSPGWDLEYIGAKVEDFNSDTWLAAQAVESQHQVRFLSSSRMLVWDYLVNEWSEWTQASGKDLAMWRASPMLLDSAPKKEQSTFSAVDYAMIVVTGWLKPAQMQGMARLRRMMVLGEYKADHAQALEVGFDYATTYTDAVSMGFQSLTVGNPTQFRHGPSRQRIEAVRAKITITAGRSGGGEIPASPTYPAADAVTLTGLAFEVGLRRGLYARLPAEQKR